MLTVVMTLMPAPRMSMTSCQRFSFCPEPGTLVWGQLVDQGDVGPPAQDRAEVHLL